MRSLIVIALCILVSVNIVICKVPTVPYFWGPKGHSTVATIAQALVNQVTTSNLVTLLPDSNGEMAPIASWADDIRSNPAYDWSHPLHFINTPTWACNYNRARDCIDSDYGNNYCVDTAIQNYTQRTLDSQIGAAQNNEAIKFLVHFLGDIHQPLHCGFGADYGGNDIKGTYESSDWNLHAIWDDALISTRIDNDYNGNEAQWTNALVQNVQSMDNATLASWVACSDNSEPYEACTQEWANESIKLACQYSYVQDDGKTHIKNGFDLEDPYYNRNIPIVESQLMKGGVRLANILNQMFAAGRMPKPSF